MLSIEKTIPPPITPSVSPPLVIIQDIKKRDEEKKVEKVEDDDSEDESSDDENSTEMAGRIASAAGVEVLFNFSFYNFCFFSNYIFFLSVRLIDHQLVILRGLRKKQQWIWNKKINLDILQVFVSFLALKYT